MRTQPIGLLTIALAACGQSEMPSGPGPECTNGAEAQVSPGSSAAIRGSISLRDKRDLTLDDSGTPMSLVVGRASATFADFSTVTSTPSQLMPLGSTCVGIVSRPVTMGQPKRLDVAGLELHGTAIGDLSVTRTSTGVYATTGSELILPQSGAIRIVAGATPGGYPAFDEMIAPVHAMEVSEPKSDGKSFLAPDDLLVSWTAGDGEYVQITVLPKFPPAMMMGGGQVSCIAADDGCFTVPGAAAVFLLASQTEEYTLSVERHRHLSATPGAGVALDVEAISEVRLTLKNGVSGP